MVEWQSPQVIRICFDVLASVATLTLGVFIWYLCTTFYLMEWRVLTGRVKLSVLVHVPYLLGRYAYLASVTMFVTIMHWQEPGPLNCEAVMVLMVIFGDICIVTSSMNMATRIRAVWCDSKIVQIITIAFTVGHLALAVLVPVTSVKVYWTPMERMCQEVNEYGQINMFVFYLYTVVWDTIILVLTVWGLKRQGEVWATSLGNDLRWQGLLYIACTVVTNSTMMFFALADYNALMDVASAVPGGAINVILSSFMVTYFMEEDDSSEVPTDTLYGQYDKKRDSIAASTVVDLTDAYCGRTSSETQDGRFSSSVPEVRIQTPSTFDDGLSLTCYSSEHVNGDDL